MSTRPLRQCLNIGRKEHHCFHCEPRRGQGLWLVLASLWQPCVKEPVLGTQYITSSFRQHDHTGSKFLRAQDEKKENRSLKKEKANMGFEPRSLGRQSEALTD